jgi:3'-5' exoribonuclease
MSIEELKQAAAKAGITGIEATIHAQVIRVEERTTRGNKPFLDLELADSTGSMSMKVWSDHGSYLLCKAMKPREFIAIEGLFKSSEYGMESPWWRRTYLNADQVAALLAGDAKLLSAIEADLGAIERMIATMKSAVYRGVCQAFLGKPGYRKLFMRAAAGRKYHHNRRGGLVAHTAQMMRAAEALAAVYPGLNRSLLLAGVLFHDSGKIMENHYEEDGFLMPYNDSAELLGHISIGVEIVRKLWRDIGNGEGPDDHRAELLALCHLILAHHGELEYGSPLQPKMIEAQILHYVDQIDAKVEMMRGGYATATQLAPGIFEKTRPMRVNLVKSPEET